MIEFMMDHYWLCSFAGFVGVVLIFLIISYGDRRNWKDKTKNEQRKMDDSI